MDFRHSEVRESERKAHSQAEMLKNALDEHSLELRVKAANEAEAACEQRLSAAEAEIEDLRSKLDASERLVFWCTSTLIMILLHWQTCVMSIVFSSLINVCVCLFWEKSLWWWGVGKVDGLKFI